MFVMLSLVLEAQSSLLKTCLLLLQVSLAACNTQHCFAMVLVSLHALQPVLWLLQMLAHYCDVLLLGCTLQLNNAVCISGCPAGDGGDGVRGLTSWGLAGTRSAGSSMAGLDMYCSALPGPATTAEPCARDPPVSVQDLPI